MSFLGDLLRRRAPAAFVGALAPAHAEALSEIHAAAFVRPWSPLDFETFLAERNIVADGLFFGRSARPRGFALSRTVGDEAELLSIALAASARGRGHGATLLVRHLGSLAQAGVREIHLEVEEGNRPAIALYRRHGFAQVGRREGYYPRPDGSRAAALTMGRRL